MLLGCSTEAGGRRVLRQIGRRSHRRLVPRPRGQRDAAIGKKAARAALSFKVRMPPRGMVVPANCRGHRNTQGEGEPTQITRRGC
jgi:hypothetical protein